MERLAGTSPGPVTFAEGRVADVMTWGALTCLRDAPLPLVARMMAGHRVHALIVLGSADDPEGLRPLWGVISDRELIAAASAGGFRAGSAGEAADRDPPTVTPDDRMTRAAKLMTESARSHLVVVDQGSGQPVGVVSALDLAGVLAVVD